MTQDVLDVDVKKSASLGKQKSTRAELTLALEMYFVYAKRTMREAGTLRILCSHCLSV
jgi:hypothetical protein